jgi:hypothetical protein
VGKKFVVTGVLDSMYRNDAEDLVKRHGGAVTTVWCGAVGWRVVVVVWWGAVVVWCGSVRWGVVVVWCGAVWLWCV